MITITYTYERPTDEYPFYPDTSEGSAFQGIIENIGKDLKLVIARSSSRTEDGLTLISTYEFESKIRFSEFTAAIHLSIPTFFRSRNAYLLHSAHRLSAIANEPVFPSSDDTQLELTMVMPK